MRQEIFEDPHDFLDWDLSTDQPLFCAPLQFARVATGHRQQSAASTIHGEGVQQGWSSMVRLLPRRPLCAVRLDGAR